MTSPHIEGAIHDEEGRPAIIIAWSPGTDRGALLPESYFAKVRPGYSATDNEFIETVKFVSPRKLVVRFTSAFAESARNRTVMLGFEFPDRREGIGCSHRGMADHYELFVEMKFDDRGQMISSQVTQSVSGGAI